MATTRPASRLRIDRRLLPAALILVLAVAAIYGRTYRHEFIMFDDDVYIFKNPAVMGGLSWGGFLWSFGYHAGNWHPLTWLSHMLDAQLFGLWAGGHHLVNAGLHAVNAAVLIGVLTAMTGAFWRSAAVAALFALHPLRVESVAWAAERKDVLSALLWLLTMGAYLRYARRPGLRRYLAALGLFALGLAAKPMLVTLPFALLLLDWWPLGRALPRRKPGLRPAVLAGPGTCWALFVEKTPFLVLSLLSSIVTLRGQTVDVLQSVTPELATRLANAAVSSLRYLGSFVRPAELAFLYPYPREGVSGTAAAAAALVLISAVAFTLGGRHPSLPMGWLWYLGTLVPVIGFVQVGGQARSDRYTYLTMIGITVALVWLSAAVWPRHAAARRVLSAAFVLALAALVASSVAYVRVWRDSLALFEYTAGVTTGNFLVLNNLGSILMDRGRGDEALRVLREAEAVNPGHCNAPYNQGWVLLSQKRFAEALGPLTRALACYQNEGRSSAYIADTHFNLGVGNNQLGRYFEAERHFRTVKRIAPHFPGVDIALGDVSARRGRKMPGRPGK